MIFIHENMSETTAASAATQQATTTTDAAPPAQQLQSSTMDFASILSKIQSLEKEKSDMRAQLEMAHGKLSKLQVCCPSFEL